jgi:hypothetical protein
MNLSDALNIRLLATAPHTPEKPGFEGSINAGMDCRASISNDDVIVRAFQWTNTGGGSELVLVFDAKTGEIIGDHPGGALFPLPERDAEGEEVGTSSTGCPVAIGVQAIGDTHDVEVNGYVSYPTSPDHIIRLPGHNGAALAFLGMDAFDYTTINAIGITATCGTAITNGLYVFIAFAK